MVSGLNLYMAILLVCLTVGEKWAGAQVHHVVGSDQGWDPSSDIASWSSGRTFRLGDTIWFTYSAAQESIVELRSHDEYLSCDLTNPIRMLTDGLNKISLEEEGIRYFASGTLESCKNGLKLPVEVQPQEKGKIHTVGSSSSNGAQKALAATGPTPSSSTHLSGLLHLLFIGLLLCYMGLM